MTNGLGGQKNTRKKNEKRAETWKKVFRRIKIERRINGIGKCDGLEQSKVRKTRGRKTSKRAETWKKVFRRIEIERRINRIGKCDGLKQSKVRKTQGRK